MNAPLDTLERRRADLGLLAESLTDEERAWVLYAAARVLDGVRAEDVPGLAAQAEDETHRAVLLALVACVVGAT